MGRLGKKGSLNVLHLGVLYYCIILRVHAVKHQTCNRGRRLLELEIKFLYSSFRLELFFLVVKLEAFLIM